MEFIKLMFFLDLFVNIGNINELYNVEDVFVV